MCGRGCPKNSPNVFQEAVMKILDGLEVAVYIDDVCFAEDNEAEHLDRPEKVVDKC